jgi:WD40 repeat protein
MMAVGSEDGTVSFYDSRTASHSSSTRSISSPFTTLNVASATKDYGFADDNSLSNLLEVTSLAFSPNGVNMAFGTASGCVALYDIRSSKPLHIKEVRN